MFYTDLLNYDSFIVREAYYGKNKDFLIIEKEMDNIVRMANEDRHFGSNNKIADSDSVRIIEKQFEKIFDLQKFVMAFYTTAPLPYKLSNNAFTVAKPFNFIRQKKNKNRVDSRDMLIGVNVNLSLIRSAQLTGEELLAIVLHEIGHTMMASIFPVLSSLSLGMFITIPLKEIINVPLAYYNKGTEFIIEHIPGLKRLLNLVDSIKLNISYLLNNIIAIQYLPEIINSGGVSSLFGYGEEKYADSFATAYGYGPALSKALAKTDLMKGVLMSKTQNVPVFNWFYDLTKASVGIVSGLIDPHPRTANRILAQLKKLKRDVEDPNISPEIRKLAKEDIANLEAFVNEHYLSLDNKDNRNNIFSWMVNRLVINTFKGNVDPREIFRAFDIEE